MTLIAAHSSRRCGTGRVLAGTAGAAERRRPLTPPGPEDVGPNPRGPSQLAGLDPFGGADPVVCSSFPFRGLRQITLAVVGDGVSSSDRRHVFRGVR